MKSIKVLIIFSLLLGLVSCQDDKDKKLSPDLINISKSADNPSDKQAAISFDKTEFNFGKILQGEVVTYTFHFTNTGNVPLLITSIDKSCGCTTGDYPRTPIDPGQGGDIKVSYDSKGHFGFQSKTVTVNTNAIPSRTTLTVKAEVRTPDQL